MSESTEVLETEIVIYCKIGNTEGLSKANKIEKHIQLDSSFIKKESSNKSSRCRVRQTTIDNKDTYEFTFKVDTSTSEDISGIEANKEFTVEVDKDFFEGFKSVAASKVIKTRYIFNSDNIYLTINEEDNKKVIEIPDIKYEVDIYTLEDQTICEWAKIDVEIDNIINYLNTHHPDIDNVKLNVRITHLPFDPTDPILCSEATLEQKEFIDELWSKFNLPCNPEIIEK